MHGHRRIKQKLHLYMGKRKSHVSTGILNRRIRHIGLLAIVTDRSCRSFTGNLRARVTRTVTSHPRGMAVRLFGSRSLQLTGNRAVVTARSVTRDVCSSLLRGGCVGGKRLASGFCRSHGRKRIVFSSRLASCGTSVVAVLTSVCGPERVRPGSTEGDGVGLQLSGSGLRGDGLRRLLGLLYDGSACAMGFSRGRLMRETVRDLGRGLEMSRLCLSIVANRVRGVGSGTTLVSKRTFGMSTGRTRCRGVSTVTGSRMGCSLLNGLASTAGLAQRTITRVLSQVGPGMFNRFGDGPRSFVVGTSRLVGRRGTYLVMGRVRCAPVSRCCSMSIFAQTAVRKHLKMGAVGTSGRLCSRIEFSSRGRGAFVRELRRGSRVRTCMGLPNGFCVPAPVKGCRPS